MRIIIVSFILLVLLVSPAASTEPELDHAWVRELNLSAAVGGHFEPFEIVGIWTDRGNHLFGRFVFYNYKDGKSTPPVVTVQGTRKADGTFWPHVSAQVTSDTRTQWKTIGSPSTPGETAVLYIAQKPEREQFYVNLDIFRPLIGKMKYGRVRLKTAESAVFALDDLLPPKVDEDLNVERKTGK